MTTGLVCPFGQIELLCRTNGTVLQWDVDVPNGIGVMEVGSQFVPPVPPATLQPIVIRDSTILLISIISQSPLISSLEINNTFPELNGTRIVCVQSMERMSTTVITITGNGNVYIYNFTCRLL